jgi:hypothetical protein
MGGVLAGSSLRGFLQRSVRSGLYRNRGTVIGSARVALLIIAAAAVSGCAATRTGAEFASIGQSPKAGTARVVVLQERAYSGVFDRGLPVALDGEIMGELKTGTFVYRDRPAGRHQLSVDLWDTPGTTRYDFVAAPGRTYYFSTRASDRSKAMFAGAAFGGLAGLAITAAATSNAQNPGPIDFVPVDEATARQMLAELRLAQ